MSSTLTITEIPVALSSQSSSGSLPQQLSLRQRAQPIADNNNNNTNIENNMNIPNLSMGNATGTTAAAATAAAGGGAINSSDVMTPQYEYLNALNFNENNNVTANPLLSNAAVNNNATQLQQQSKLKTMMANFIKTTNDSRYVYPSIAIIVASLFVVILLFQKISTAVKIIAVILLLLFIAFTIYQFKQH